MMPIKSLKKRISINGTLIVQNESGFIGEMGFEWNDPANDYDITKFEQKNNIILPKEFKEFLRTSNGAVLFKDLKYGQWGCRILGLDDLIAISNEVTTWGLELKPEWLVFATWYGDCDILIFDLHKCNLDDKNYIIDGSQGDREKDWINIRGGFSKWIDRLIVAQGAKYWRWY